MTNVTSLDDYRGRRDGRAAEHLARIQRLEAELAVHQGRCDDLRRMVALTEPFWVEIPDQPLAAVRAVMPAGDALELDAIVARLWPGQAIA